MIKENKSERNSREGRAKKGCKAVTHCCWAGSFGKDKKCCEVTDLMLSETIRKVGEVEHHSKRMSTGWICEVQNK